MKKIKMVFLLLMTSYFSYSQTYISGSILSNTIWSPSGNPFIVTGNIVVFEGVTLTINPGVIVKFDSGTGLELRGKLIAIGNAVDTITFTSNLISPVHSSWIGITVIGTTNPLGVGDQVRMEYCKGEYAHYFVDLDFAYHGPYIFRHCYFTNNYQVNNDGGMPTTIFEKCKFESNDLALAYCQFDSRVSNCYFINNINGVDGIANVDTCFFSGNTGVALSPYGSTVGCTIENNNKGVRCFFNAVNDTFINNTVTNNSVGVEILSYFNGSINFTDNTICNNTTYNIKLLHTNNADLSNNCWCSTDSTFIRSTIYDGYVNSSYGLVNFMTFTTGCPQISVGINNSSSSNNLQVAVFPNPFNNKIEIINEVSEITEVIIYDINSRKVLHQKFTHSISLNTEQLPEGIYFYQIQGLNGLSTKGKMVKD
jgi:hypothetical protein